MYYIDSIADLLFVNCSAKKQLSVSILLLRIQVVFSEKPPQDFFSTQGIIEAMVVSQTDKNDGARIRKDTIEAINFVWH